jgi:hypothetical protein
LSRCSAVDGLGANDLLRFDLRLFNGGRSYRSVEMLGPNANTRESTEADREACMWCYQDVIASCASISMVALLHTIVLTPDCCHRSKLAFARRRQGDAHHILKNKMLRIENRTSSHVRRKDTDAPRDLSLCQMSRFFSTRNQYGFVFVEEQKVSKRIWRYLPLDFGDF